MNIFKEILKKLPESQIEVVPNDPKDQEAATQMTQMIRYASSKAFKLSNKDCCGKEWVEQVDDRLQNEIN